VGRTGAVCVSCGSAVALEYVRETSRQVGLGSQLMAVAAEGNRSRIYLAPTNDQTDAAAVAKPEDVPPGELFDWPGRINVYRYGLTQFQHLFTHRQLVALTRFRALLAAARTRILADARAANSPSGVPLEQGGTDAEAYADAVVTYLSFPISRM